MHTKRNSEIILRRYYIAGICLAALSSGWLLPPASHGLGTARDEPQLGVGLQVSFSPGPVQPSTCSGSFPSWTTTVTITETRAIGLTVSQCFLDFVDLNDDITITSQKFSSDDFARVFTGCGAGSSRIPANGKACATFCIDGAGHSEGRLLFTVEGKYDEGPFFSAFGCNTVNLLPPQPTGADLSLTVESASIEGLLATVPYPLLYTCKVTNKGPETAKGVILTTSTLPNTTLNTVAVSQGTFVGPSAGGTGSVRCSIGTLGPGASAIVWVVLNVQNVPAFSTLTPSAVVSSDTFDPTLDENSSSAQVFVDPLPPMVPDAELSISMTETPSLPAAGTRATYTLVLRNSGPDDSLTNTVIFVLPEGTTFASASVLDSNTLTFVGLTPQLGEKGAVVFAYVFVPVNSVRTAQVVVNVLSNSGSNLTGLCEILQGSGPDRPDLCAAYAASPSAPEKDTTRNSSRTNDTVLGGRNVSLVWEQLSSSSGQPTPAPVNLRVTPGGLSTPRRSIGRLRAVFPSDTSCTLVKCNIYKSDSPNVQTVPDNLWKTVPPDEVQATLAAAPVGSFYVVTNVWNCGGMLIESGGSNECSSSGSCSHFSLGLNQPTVTTPVGNKVPITININRTAGYAGNVTVVTPDTVPKGVRIVGGPVSTTDNVAKFRIKVKDSAQQGTYQLTFTGTDDSGGAGVATLTLILQANIGSKSPSESIAKIQNRPPQARR